MKRSALILFVILLSNCFSSKGQTDNSKEEAAIKAVIEGEIKASFNGDYNTWEGFFVHEPYVVWMQGWKEGYACWKGWQDISNSAKTFIKPERKGTSIHNGNSDYTIKVYGAVAFVSFKSKITRISEGKSSEDEAMEARLLEKHDGIWKIAYLSSIYTATYK
jgi:hypothetical protein